MSSKKLITVFGATGNQGGSVIDTVLGRQELKDKYSLRGISRDPSSGKSKKLSEQGVEMVKAELDDVESLKAALKDSYGAFGVTDFWSLLDKNKEIQQGKNLFEACKAAGVKHYVFSALPNVTKMTDGKWRNVDHFDSKAEVMEYIEANKGSMIASYFMPAMFMDVMRQVRVADGTPTLSLPFPSDSVNFPLLAPRRDTGKFVVGLLEGGSEANGVQFHGASTWTTPKDVVGTLSKESGQDVKFNPISEDEFYQPMAKARGDKVAREIADMMQFIGEYSYFGKGEEKNQAEHNKWLLKGAETASFPQWASENGPWKFQ